MKMPSSTNLVIFVFLVGAAAQAQSSRSIDQITRPRVVGTGETTTARTKSQEPSSQRPVPPRPQENPEKSPAVNQSPQDEVRASVREDSKHLSPNRLRSRINEAERLMKSQPVPTAMTQSLDYVTVAALLPETSQIQLIRINKQTFLSKGSEVSAVSTLGLPVQVRIVRANGVNTAVTIFDDKNRSLSPLVVAFPIERNGVFREMAYYTSAHPALLSADLMKTGQTYVNSMVDLAAKRLRDRGNPIAPNRRRRE
jgi:hypothetical protein